jgi:CheY-like chemotaxis protein
MRILYVEDNPANLSLMLRIARMGNHEVISYIQGEEALEHFTRDKPDIVLLDLQLAGSIGGMEVMRTLRARGVHLPIIAVTAYAMLGDRERCLEAGFSDYMAKPLQVAELVDRLQKHEAALIARRAAEAAAEPEPAVSVLPELAENAVSSEERSAPQPDPSVSREGAPHIIPLTQGLDSEGQGESALSTGSR